MPKVRISRSTRVICTNYFIAEPNADQSCGTGLRARIWNANTSDQFFAGFAELENPSSAGAKDGVRSQAKSRRLAARGVPGVLEVFEDGCGLGLCHDGGKRGHVGMPDGFKAAEMFEQAAGGGLADAGNFPQLGGAIADLAALSAVVTKSQAEAILEYFRKTSVETGL